MWRITQWQPEALNGRRLLPEKYGFSKAYGSYEEMLADPQVDLVYIATPHSHHYLHAKMCLEAGKNVLCEKAFTVNADQARKLFALAEREKPADHRGNLDQIYAIQKDDR